MATTQSCFFLLGDTSNLPGELPAMNRSLILLVLALFSMLALGANVHRSIGSEEEPGPVHRGPVVVELFTSEGCSSCPPADRLLAQLDASQSVGDAEVIALEEHVNYWDQLGWVDPFSSQQATLRQLAYAGALGNENAYTPQMVVDGGTEFVGSRKGAAERAIAEAGGAEKVSVQISPAPEQSAAARKFQIRVGELTARSEKDAQVWLAVTESSLHSDVTRGENAGETLYHGPVVRSLTKLGSATETGDASFQTTREVRADSRWKIENLKIVVFVQDGQTKHILGASQVRFSE